MLCWYVFNANEEAVNFRFTMPWYTSAVTAKTSMYDPIRNSPNDSFLSSYKRENGEDNYATNSAYLFDVAAAAASIIILSWFS